MGSIESERLSIAGQYGTLSPEEDQYVIPPEKIEEVNKEMSDLLNLTQEVQIYTVKLEDLNDDLMLTTAQMEALLFMIEQ